MFPGLRWAKCLHMHLWRSCVSGCKMRWDRSGRSWGEGSTGAMRVDDGCIMVRRRMKATHRVSHAWTSRAKILAARELRGGACVNSQSLECGRFDQNWTEGKERKKTLLQKYIRRSILEKKWREGWEPMLHPHLQWKHSKRKSSFF